MRLKRRNKRYDSIDTYNLESLITPQDYRMALSSYRYKKVFFCEINTMSDQINRFIKRQNTLTMILYQNFNNDEYLTSVMQVVNDSERMLYSNVKASLECLAAFDEQEYEKIREKKERKAKEEENYQQMKQQIQRVESIQKTNEALIVEVDRLLTRLSRIIISEEPNDLSKLKACTN